MKRTANGASTTGHGTTTTSSLIPAVTSVVVRTVAPAQTPSAGAACSLQLTSTYAKTIPHGDVVQVRNIITCQCVDGLLQKCVDNRQCATVQTCQQQRSCVEEEVCQQPTSNGGTSTTPPQTPILTGNNGNTTPPSSSTCPRGCRANGCSPLTTCTRQGANGQKTCHTAMQCHCSCAATTAANLQAVQQAGIRHYAPGASDGSTDPSLTSTAPALQPLANGASTKPTPTSNNGATSTGTTTNGGNNGDTQPSCQRVLRCRMVHVPNSCRATRQCPGIPL